MYSDPITSFVVNLYENFDFEAAQKSLKDCHKVLSNDFFLQSSANKFVYEARLLLCEVYCTINRKVDIAVLAEKLELTEEEAERWMVDMVRGATSGVALDARIDSSGKQVLMSVSTRSAHQLVLDHTRDLTARSAALATNLDSIVQEQAFYVKLR
eukprot:gene173-174_t